MNQPMGRVVALQYRSIGPQLTHSVLRVHIRTHMDTMEHHDLQNMQYTVQCPALQFMALYDFPPSSLDGTYCNVEDAQLIVPIAPMPPDSWGLARTALEGGDDALREAEWFDGVDLTEEGGDSQKPPGGPGPDPGTGNRGGVEEPSEAETETGVTVEQAPADSDAGINVTVE